MSDAELYALSSEIDEWDEDADLFDGCDPVESEESDEMEWGAGWA